MACAQDTKKAGNLTRAFGPPRSYGVRKTRPKRIRSDETVSHQDPIEPQQRQVGLASRGTAITLRHRQARIGSPVGMVKGEHQFGFRNAFMSKLGFF